MKKPIRYNYYINTTHPQPSISLYGPLYKANPIATPTLSLASPAYLIKFILDPPRADPVSVTYHLLLQPCLVCAQFHIKLTISLSLIICLTLLFVCLILNRNLLLNLSLLLHDTMYHNI